MTNVIQNYIVITKSHEISWYFLIDFMTMSCVLLWMTFVVHNIEHIPDRLVVTGFSGWHLSFLRSGRGSRVEIVKKLIPS